MARMVPSGTGVSYLRRVRLSVMVSVSAMSTLRLRRRRAPAVRGSDSPPRSSVQDQPACTAHCRTAARPDRQASYGSTRTPDRAAPCATCVLYLMEKYGGRFNVQCSMFNRDGPQLPE